MWEKGGAWVWGERGTREKGRGRPSTQHTDTTTDDTGVLRTLQKERKGRLPIRSYVVKGNIQKSDSDSGAGTLIIFKLMRIN